MSAFTIGALPHPGIEPPVLPGWESALTRTRSRRDCSGSLFALARAERSDLLV